MSDEEKHITDLETRIPSVSGSAFEMARRETLASGQSVLSSDRGVIYRISPSGSRQEVKKVEAPTQVTRGAKVKLR